MYHEVSSTVYTGFEKYVVTPKRLSRHLRILAAFGYRSVSIGDLLASHRGETRLPGRAVVLTFDDGFRDCVRYAVPILHEHNARAIIYLVAGLVGAKAEWLLADRGVELALADWAALQEALNLGVEFGSHTVSHPRLAEVSEAELTYELATSRAIIEEKLGISARHFAYPHGSFNSCVRSSVEEAGYDSACSTQIGLSGAEDDKFALHRILIDGRDSDLEFLCKVTAGQTPRELLRLALGL